MDIDTCGREAVNMHYAINIADWAARKNDYGLAILLQPIVNQCTVDAELRRGDGVAVTLECGEERAKAVVDIIRQRFKRYEFRCYHSKTGKGSWKRI